MRKLPPGLTRTDGKFRIRFRSKSRPGKTYSERLAEGITRRDAERVLRQRRTEDHLGELAWPDERKDANARRNSWAFEDVVLELYLPHLEARVAPSTLKRYKRALRELWQWFEGVPLEQIDKASVSRFCTERKAQGVRGRTVNIELQQLTQLLNFAYDHGYLPHPPPRFKKMPQKDSRDADWLTPEQFELVYEQALVAGHPWPCYVMLRTYTGCRPSEGRDIQIHQLDLVGKLIRFGSADTKDADARTINLTEQVVAHVRNLIQWLEEYLGPLQPNDYLFQHIAHSRRRGETGRGLRRIPDFSASGRKRYPWDPPEMRVSPHTFRHTFAAWQLRQGTNIAIVAGLLGHANVQLTYDTYGHIQPEHHVNEIENLPLPGRLRVVGGMEKDI